MKCHICDRTTERFCDAKRNITYYHCDSCEYIFKDPAGYQSIAEQKSRYDLHENDESDEGYRAYFRRFLDFILPHIGTPQYALDFGCGKSTLLANILKNINIDCKVYDPIYHPDTSYNSKKYELILSTEVFEHLHDPRETFSHLVSLLEPCGYLALQTQFHSNDLQSFLDWYYHKDPTHIVFFRPRTFEVLAQMHGCGMIADNGKNMVILQKGKA